MAWALYLLLALHIAHVYPEYLSKHVSQCNDSLLEKTLTDGSPRLSVLRDGDFIIQSIIPLTSEATSCDRIMEGGLVMMMSFQFAIDKVNGDTTILNGYHLGYQIDDTCENIPTVMARGIEIVSQFRPQSVCHDRACNSKSAIIKKISAAIGTSNSFTSVPLASLLGLYGIPIISPAASSRLLSKKSQYKSFFRTIPSDLYQALAIMDVLRHFDWHYVYAIGSDDNYGKLGISTMKEYAEDMNYCIVADNYIPYMTQGMESKAKQIAKNLKNAPNAQVVVLFVYDIQMKLVLREAKKLGLERVWVTSDAVRLFQDGIFNDTNDDLVGILRVSPSNNRIPGFHDYVKNKIATEVHCNEFIAMFLEQRFGCQINSTSIYCSNETLDSMTSKILQYDNFIYGNTVNALYAAAYALKALMIKKCNYTKPGYNKTACPPIIPLVPKELTDELFKVNFTSLLDTTILFNEDGDPSYPRYTVENVQRRNGELTYVKIGEWDHINHFQLVDNQTVKWPVWLQPATATPRSRCNDDCKPGEFVSARTECCWSCQRCPVNHITNKTNAEKCQKCPHGYYTISNTECTRYQIVYLTIKQAAGISITVVSVLGIVLLAGISAAYWKLGKYLPPNDSRLPHVHYLSLVNIVSTFIFGNMLLTERTSYYCNLVISLVGLLFSNFGLLLLARTHFFSKIVRNFIYPGCRLALVWSHSLLMGIFMLLHIILIAVTCTEAPVRLQTMVSTDKTEMIKECNSNFNALQMITIVIYPSALLLIATITAFRERGNDQQTHSESRFLNFAAIAMCIVVVACLATFRFVAGNYRPIVMAFTVDMFAFIYIGCLILPKLYFAYTNKIRTISEVNRIVMADTSFSGGEMVGQPRRQTRSK